MLNSVSSPLGEFKLAPDNSRVVYRQSLGGSLSVLSVPILGGYTVQLNPQLVSGGNVQEGFEMTPDGATVVYIADKSVNNRYELFSVSIAGGESTKLNPFSTFIDVLELSITPDGNTVVYRADQETDGKAELFSVLIEGGSLTKLNGPIVPGGDVLESVMSPDGQWVVYIADQENNNVKELYSTPVLGGPVTKLNGPLPAGGDILAPPQITSDSSTVGAATLQVNGSAVRSVERSPKRKRTRSTPTLSVTVARMKTLTPDCTMVPGAGAVSTISGGRRSMVRKVVERASGSGFPPRSRTPSTVRR